MALPNNTVILGMDVSYGGIPAVWATTDAVMNLGSLDYTFGGIPFAIAVEVTAAKIKQVHTTPWGNIKNFFGKVISGIKTFGSTSTT